MRAVDQRMAGPPCNAQRRPETRDPGPETR